MQDLNDALISTTDNTVYRRLICVKLYLSGKPKFEIASILQCSRQFVSKWTIIYDEVGISGLDLGYKGSSSYLTDEQKEQIYQWIQKHDSMTVEKITQYIEDEFQVIYKSKQSYYDLLELGGMSYHKTFPVNPKKDEAQVLEKREEIKKNFWHKTKR